MGRKKSFAKIRKTKKGIIVRKKIDLFAEEFIKNEGNATEAAMKTWNCSSRKSAQTMGNRAMKQLKGAGRLYLESRGYHYGKLMDTALEKMEKAKKPDWWDRIMKIGGYEDFISKKGASPVAVNVFALHDKLASDYVDGEIETIEELPEPK